MAEATARILVVDDEPAIRDLLRRRLEKERYRVAVAKNGRDALAAIGRDRPDLLITDLSMPDLDGIALVERLRASADTAALPIIMLTALNTAQDKTIGLDTGADDYLGKPFEFPELLARVRSLLRRAQRPGSGTLGTGLLSPDTKGYIAGLTLFSVLQMLNLDRNSGELRVVSRDRVGILSLVDGELVDAQHRELTGEVAAYEILSWDDAQVEIRDAVAATARRIRTPLHHILMEAVRLQDEYAELALAEDALAASRS